jgi:ribonuclease HI
MEVQETILVRLELAVLLLMKTAMKFLDLKNFWARPQTTKEVNCFLDSELVVKQLNGFYKIKHPELKPLVEKVILLKKDFAVATFTYIPREKNKIADSLVNEAIDEAATS